MKQMRHLILDDPLKWDGVLCPPFFDREAFQKRIDKIVGVNRNQKSIIKLVWLPEVWTTVLGERVRRYWTKRERREGDWVYFSPPRWGFERRLEPEAYWEAHEASRYQVDEKTGEVMDFGPPPAEYYVFDDGGLIADHDEFYVKGEPKCCYDAWIGEFKVRLENGLIHKEYVNSRRRCWGYYREPDESDIARLAQAVKSRDEAKYVDPYAPLSKEQLAVLEIEANVQGQRAEQEANNYLNQVSHQFNVDYGHRLTESDPTRLRHGRFHFTAFNTVTGEDYSQSAWTRKGEIYTPN